MLLKIPGSHLSDIPMLFTYGQIYAWFYAQVKITLTQHNFPWQSFEIFERLTHFSWSNCSGNMLYFSLFLINRGFSLWWAPPAWCLHLSRFADLASWYVLGWALIADASSTWCLRRIKVASVCTLWAYTLTTHVLYNFYFKLLVFWGRDIFSRTTTRSKPFCFLLLRGLPLKGRICLGANSSLVRAGPFQKGKDLVCRKANRMSQKLSPL